MNTKVTIPAEVWRDLMWEKALAILAELTAAGEDRAAVAAVLIKLQAFNAAKSQAVYHD